MKYLIALALSLALLIPVGGYAAYDGLDVDIEAPADYQPPTPLATAEPVAVSVPAQSSVSLFSRIGIFFSSLIHWVTHLGRVGG